MGHVMIICMKILINYYKSVNPTQTQELRKYTRDPRPKTGFRKGKNNFIAKSTYILLLVMFLTSRFNFMINRIRFKGFRKIKLTGLFWPFEVVYLSTPKFSPRSACLECKFAVISRDDLFIPQIPA
jgi:hypothetical protein